MAIVYLLLFGTSQVKTHFFTKRSDTCMVRARVDQKTFMAFMIPFLLTIATAGLLLLAVYSSPDPDNSVLVDILLNL